MSNERTKLVEIWLEHFGDVVYKEDKPKWVPMKLAILENLSSPEGIRPLYMYGPAIVFPVITASALAGAQYREFAIATCRLVGERAVLPLIQLLDSVESYQEVFTSLYKPYHKLSAEADAIFAIGTSEVIALDSLSDIIGIDKGVANRYPAIRRLSEHFSDPKYVDRVKWSARGLGHYYKSVLGNL